MVSRLLPLSKFCCPGLALRKTAHEISSRTQIEESIYATSYLFCIFLLAVFYKCKMALFPIVRLGIMLTEQCDDRIFYNVIMESFLLRKLIIYPFSIDRNRYGCSLLKISLSRDTNAIMHQGTTSVRRTFRDVISLSEFRRTLL